MTTERNMQSIWQLVRHAVRAQLPQGATEDKITEAVEQLSNNELLIHISNALERKLP